MVYVKGMKNIPHGKRQALWVFIFIFIFIIVGILRFLEGKEVKWFM